jgi:hypothetical protein
VGDRVLVRRVRFDGKHKLQDYWEEEVHVVVQQKDPGLPVFDVRREDRTGKVRRLHRNLLLPLPTELEDTAEYDNIQDEEESVTGLVGYSSSEDEDEDIEPPVTRSKVRGGEDSKEQGRAEVTGKEQDRVDEISETTQKEERTVEDDAEDKKQVRAEDTTEITEQEETEENSEEVLPSTAGRDDDDLNVPIAFRKAKRNVNPPQRFSDFITNFEGQLISEPSQREKLVLLRQMFEFLS